MTGEAAVFEAFETGERWLRLRYGWAGRSYAYRLELQGAGVRRPPPEALAFRVGLAYAPYFAGFLSPERIVVRAAGLDDAERALWERWYTLSLAEKSYRNGLAIGTSLAIESDRAPAPLETLAEAGTLLLNGGGKDTAAGAELLKAAGVPFRWLAIREGEAQRAVRAASGVGDGWTVKAGWESVPPVSLFRYAGTAPALLFYDLVGVLAAEMCGLEDVVVCNERSADVANLVHQGIEVNHQYTKSLAFEQDLDGLVRGPLGSRVRLWSVLRPLYDLQAAELFSLFPAYHRGFVSCNVGQVGGRGEWCRKCAKCAFTFLALWPFLADELPSIFGANLLDDASLLPTFLELAGLQGHTPFECVGTPLEAAAALALAPARPAPAVIRDLRGRLAPETLARAAESVLGGYAAAPLTPQPLRAPLERAYRSLVARRRNTSPAPR